MSISQNFPNTRPSLNLNFARSKTLDPRITFIRIQTGNDASYVDEDGLIKYASANEPRFDHDPETGECLGLLIEEQKSNLITYSSDMSQWSANVSPIYADNDTTAPDGTLTADKLTGNNSAADGRYIAVTISTNTTYTVASFIKPTDQPRTRIGVFSTVDSWYGNVDTDWDANGEPTTDNSVGASNIKYEPYPNGWYRVSFQFTSPATINGDVSYFHMPDRTISGKSAWFWGAQLETSSFASSYIPTEGSTKTRTKDYPTISGTNFTDFYNSSEGTIYVKYNIKGSFATDGFNRIFEVSDGGSANRYTALLRGTNQDIYEGGWNATLNFNTSLITFGDFYTYIMGYKENDFQRYTIDRNGNIDGNTDTSVTVSSFTPTELNIGYEAVNDNRQLNGHISQLVYYPARLSNSQLQTLLLQ